MDFDIQTIIAIVVGILFLIFGGARRRKPQQNTSPPPQSNPDVEVQPDSEVVLPPFMQDFEDFPEETELAEEVVNSEVENAPMVTEQSEPEPEPVQEPEPERKPEVPPPIPPDSTTPLPTRPFPVTSLIDLSPNTFRQGIILSEILGKPKTLRSRRR